MVLIFTTAALLFYTIAILCWVVAIRNCRADDWGEFWAMTPLWNMKDRFNPKGYLYLWISAVLTIIGSIIAVGLALR
jgi:hypothetical protein